LMGGGTGYDERYEVCGRAGATASDDGVCTNQLAEVGECC